MPALTLPAPWARVADAFLRSMEERSGSRKSREKYENILSLFFRDPERSCDSYTRADVQAFLDHGSFARWNAGAPISVSCRNGRCSTLSSFYSFASAYYIDGRPLFTDVSPTQGFRYLKPEIKYRNISADDFERILNVIPDTQVGWRDRCAFLLYFWLGRRRQELLTLRYGDIQPSILIDTDGTRRAGRIYVYRNKGTQRQEKAKEFPQPAWDVLQSYLLRSGRASTIRPQDYVIVPVYPGRGRKDGAKDQPLSSVQLTHHLHEYCTLAGVSPHWTIHTLRHLSARERYNAGVDIRTISGYLDHKSISTTDIYLRQLVGISDKAAYLLTDRFAHLSKF